MSEVLSQNRQALPVFPPDLNKLLDMKKREIMSDMNCTLIGTIESFDPETQTAQVTVNFLRIFTQQSSGIGQPMVDVSEPYPVLLQCPVVILNGGGGSLQFPIAAGDTCLVLFHDRDIDAWWEFGNITAPNSDRIHDLSDGIALVGVHSKVNPIEDFVTDRVRLKHGTAVLELVDDTSATLATPESSVAVEDRVEIMAGTQTLKAALDSFVDAVIAAVTTDGASMNPATITALQTAKAEIAAVLK